MNTDAYTKGILTIIAACLVWLCLNTETPVAGAQAARPQPTPVTLVGADGQPLRAVPVIVNNEAVPVAVTNRALTVAVRSIQRGAEWDPIPVQVMREPPTLRPTP
jgi:hypothetical protein